MTIATRFPKSWAIAGFDIKDPSLVLYLPLWYPYSDMAGGTIYSYDTNRYTGTVTGATWGRTGRTFNGVGDKIVISASDTLQFEASTASFSLLTWIKKDRTATVEDPINSEDANNDGWRFLFHSNTAVYLTLNGTGPNTGNLTEDTNWHCYGASMNRLGNGQMYVDGLVSGAAVDITGITMAIAADFVIGMRAYDSGGQFQGIIGEVMLYNRALSASEISRHYQVTRFLYR